jgi:hypothetical protein
MRYLLLLLAWCVFMNLPASGRDCAAQTGPKLEHNWYVAWWQPIGFVIITAENTLKQYPIVDLYVTLDSPFPPTRLGSLGTLFINPGALVYWIPGLQLVVETTKKWVTGSAFFYTPLPPDLVGIRFRVQVVAYDATVPNRMVLSANDVTVTIVN